MQHLEFSGKLTNTLDSILTFLFLYTHGLPARIKDSVMKKSSIIGLHVNYLLKLQVDTKLNWVNVRILCNFIFAC